MPLEKSLTRLFVDVKRVGRGNRLETIRLYSFTRVSNRLQEQILVPCKRELVHGIDNWQVEQHEIECCSLLTCGTIVLTILKNLLHGNLQGLLSSLCLFCSFLSLVKSVNQLNILKKRNSLIDTE